MKPESTSYNWKMLMLYQWPAAEEKLHLLDLLWQSTVSLCC